MTTMKPSNTIDAIDAILPTSQGAYTMKGPDEVLTMKTFMPRGIRPGRLPGSWGAAIRR